MEERFLKILPKIQLHGRIFFRHVKCRQTRDEAIAEMVALAWKWFVRLTNRGKDVSNFPVTFCRFAGFAVKSGRRLCGQEKPKDVMSPVAQKLKGFRVESFTPNPGHAFDAVGSGKRRRSACWVPWCRGRQILGSDAGCGAEPMHNSPCRAIFDAHAGALVEAVHKESYSASPAKTQAQVHLRCPAGLLTVMATGKFSTSMTRQFSTVLKTKELRREERPGY